MSESSTFEIVSHNRRSTPRHYARVPSSITQADQEAGLGHARRPAALIGYTNDLSDQGLAVVVPSNHVNVNDLTELHRTLRVVLALPVGYVKIGARFVRYQHMHKSEQEKGYLLGLRITDMSPTDAVMYREYIRNLN